MGLNELFNNFTALAVTLSEGFEATVDKSKDEDGNFIIFTFGILKENKGDKGDKSSDGYITITRAEFDSLVRRVQALEEQGV